MRTLLAEKAKYEAERNKQPKQAPSLSELLGNIDAIASNNLLSFGIKSRITPASQPIEIPYKIVSACKGSTQGGGQIQLSAIKSPKCNLELENMSAPREQKKVGTLYDNTSQNSKKSISITISKIIRSAEQEEDKESGSKGLPSSSKQSQLMRQQNTRGLMITPDKSCLQNINTFSPINEKLELVFSNNTRFFSPESKYFPLT